MAPNGRRRWRGYLKKCRYRSRREGKHLTMTVGAMRKVFPRGLGKYRDTPLPPRLWTPRSLVGMSSSARKRAARLACVGHRFRRRVKLLWFKRWQRDVHRRIMSASDQKTWDRYVAERSKYRIGERLRPCKYCAGPEQFERCRGVRIAVDVTGAHVRGECVFCRTCTEAAQTLRFANPDACDGTGLLPARKSKGPAHV